MNRRDFLSGLAVAAAAPAVAKSMPLPEGFQWVSGRVVVRDQVIPIDGSIVWPPNTEIDIINCHLKILANTELNFSGCRGINIEGGVIENILEDLPLG